MSGSLASLAGWYFLPGLVTGWVQTILYAVFVRVGDPKPNPGTPRFNRDRARIRIAVILLYLIYTIYEADYELREASDFYSLLGVTPSINEKGLQSRFRRLTVQYHPDKVPPAQRPQVEAIFVRLKLARDLLIEPAKRFAYDRFGEEILQWQSCKTIRDYAMHGIRSTLMYYAGTGFALLGASVLGYMQSGKFWRYLVLMLMFVVEVSIMTRPTFPAVLTSFINPILLSTGVRTPLLPFQLLSLLRKLALTVFIAISQLEPLLKDPLSNQGAAEQASPQQYERILQLAAATDQELQRLSALEITQYGIGPEADASLRSSMKEWLVQNTIRNDAEVRTAMARAFEQRRALAES